MKIAGIDGIDARAGLRFSDEAHAIQATVAGAGIALHSLLLVSDELAQGTLEVPFGPELEALLLAPGARPRQTAERTDRGRAGLVAGAIHRSAPIVL